MSSAVTLIRPKRARVPGGRGWYGTGDYFADVGLPASPQAACGGYVSPSVVNSALDCLAARTSCGSCVPPSSWPYSHLAAMP